MGLGAGLLLGDSVPNIHTTIPIFSNLRIDTGFPLGFSMAVLIDHLACACTN